MEIQGRASYQVCHIEELSEAGIVDTCAQQLCHKDALDWAKVNIFRGLQMARGRGALQTRRSTEKSQGKVERPDFGIGHKRRRDI